MTRYTSRQETQRVFGKCINDILEGKYESAIQRYDNIAEVLKERAASPYSRYRFFSFGPHYLVSGLGKGLAEGLMEKKSIGVREVWDTASDIAKEAKNLYDAFKAIENASYGDVSGFEAYRTLGRSYVSLGLAEEGIGMLERLKQPRKMDIVKLRMKAKELSGEK
ncbi:MAG: hypothetical protein WCW64_00230 [Phycisphaerae bacterium]|jgi:hypothetical protein